MIDPKFFREPRTIREAARHFKLSKVTIAYWLKARDQSTVAIGIRRESKRGPFSKTFKITPAK